jgi:RNA polymerase sigma-70 factor (ECF subfamily)
MIGSEFALRCPISIRPRLCYAGAVPDANSDSDAGAARSGAFVTTHWSVILRAAGGSAPDAHEALSELCRSYWYPLYAFVRRQGHPPPDAEDLTQAFFARLLEKGYVADAQREQGRFRTFLLTACKRFLANEWDRQHARKRGGFQPIVSIDQDLAESRLEAEPAHGLSPDVLFERQYAMTLLEHVMSRLGQEYVETGRSRLFEHLRSCLAKEAAQPYAAIAAELDLTEAAVKMAVQRLRSRYRVLLREEIARTVADAAEVEDEIRHLFATFGS